METTFINIHTTKYGPCINMYLKCQKNEAIKFIENVERLKKGVTLLAVDGGSCRDSLDVIKFKICDNIENHTYKECELYNEETEDYYNDPFLDESELKVNKMVEHTNQFYYCSVDTDLYRSIIMYSIFRLLTKIFKYVESFTAPNEITNKMKLMLDDQIIYESDTMDIRIDDCMSFPWVDICDVHSVSYIKTFNDVMQILTLAKKYKNRNMTLSFTGFGERPKPVTPDVKPKGKGKKIQTKQ